MITIHLMGKVAQYYESRFRGARMTVGDVDVADTIEIYQGRKVHITIEVMDEDQSDI